MVKLVEVVTDLFHLVLGIVTAVLILHPDIIVRNLGIILLMVYIVYECKQSKTRDELVGDLIEYIAGLAIGTFITVTVMTILKLMPTPVLRLG